VTPGRRRFLGAFLSGLAAPLGAQRPGEGPIEKVTGGYRFTDGPAWSPEGFLLFCDVPAGVILKLTPGEPVGAFRRNSGGASGNAFDTQGRLYTCETRARRVVRTDRKGVSEVLAERWEGKRLNAPNDIAVRKDGHLYFTDPAFGYQSDTRELDFYGVFHITPKRELKLAAKIAGRPNGVALSPNGRTLYVTDSDAHTVRAWDLDGKGEAANERVLVAKTEGVPGGLRTDAQGSLYVAAATVAVYTPEGQPAGAIPVPEPTSNCAFGDADLKTLYITARTSVYRVRMEAPGAVRH